MALQLEQGLAYTLTKTIFLILTWACLGLFSEITGVTLQDLRERTATDYERIGQAVSMRMFGYGFGAIFGGWLMDTLKGYNDLVIAISLMIAGVTSVAIAYTPLIEFMFIEFSIQGIVETHIAIAGQQSLVNLWKRKVAGPMHMLHLGYGAGSFLVPQIAKPFLSQREAKTSSKFYLENCLNSLLQQNTSSANDTWERDGGEPSADSHFEYAYFIIMAIIVAVASVYLVFFCIERKKQTGSSAEEETGEAVEAVEVVGVSDRCRRTLLDIVNFNACSPGHPWYAGVIFRFITVWFYIAVGGQMVFANYLYSYSRDQLCLSKSTAANIQSTFWIGFTCGRFAGFVVALWLPMKFIIFLEAGGNLVSAVILLFYPSHTMIVWVFSCVSGFFVGPLYPSGIAWANTYLTMTGLAYMVTLVGGSLAGVSFTVVIGWYFQHRGPAAFLYFVIGYSALACATAVCMHLVARTRGDKYEREEAEERERDQQGGESGKEMEAIQ